MKIKFSLNILVVLLLTVLINPFGLGASDTGAELPDTERLGVYILTHDQIVNSGARNLADLLSRVPGVRITTNSVQSMPSSGALVSSDSPTQLSANQFSRVLILFNGHRLNQNWYGGAEQEWGTGFLDGLKEIRVYTGPSAAAHHGGGAMDTVIELIPFDGKDMKGGVALRVSQSLNEDRLDKSLLHLSTGNRWGEDGSYSLLADVTRWAGVTIDEGFNIVNPDERMGRKEPSFQLTASLKKGNFSLMARHLEHVHLDPHYMKRTWSYSFIDAGVLFHLGASWQLKLGVNADYIVSKWGYASSATGDLYGNRDKVSERRAGFNAALSRQWNNTAFSLGADYRHIGSEGGPENNSDYFSLMTFDTGRSIAGADIKLMQRLTGDLWAQAVLRAEKATGYEDTALLPEISLFYKKEKTEIGLRFAIGHRYMDSWYRVGSSNYNPENEPALTPYIIAAELKPETNRQFRAWINQELGGSVQIGATLFSGKYSHLMGYDWDYAFETEFRQLQAREVGDYSYWGGSASLIYKGEKLSMGANVSFLGVTDAQLADRQLYLSEDGDKPLFLSPLTANLFMDWKMMRHLALSARLLFSGGAANAGVFYYDLNFPILHDNWEYKDTGSWSMLDLSIRVPNLWQKFELQLTVHNALNNHARLPMAEGGSFRARGREFTLTLRRRF